MMPRRSSCARDVMHFASLNASSRVIASKLHWLRQQIASSRSLRSATTAASCSTVSWRDSGCASATLRASSAKSIFSTRSISSIRDSGMSPLAKTRLTLDSDMPSASARAAYVTPPERSSSLSALTRSWVVLMGVARPKYRPAAPRATPLLRDREQHRVVDRVDRAVGADRRRRVRLADSAHQRDLLAEL